jgi:P-type Cu2+ transporter
MRDHDHAKHNNNQIKQQNNNNLSNHQDHDSMKQHHDEGDENNHHEKMIRDFQKRFIVVLILTVPVLFLTPMIQVFLNYSFTFPGVNLTVFSLSSIIYFYGGIPFFKGFIGEMRLKQPGMMTLITTAISVAYFYSGSVTFYFHDVEPFFWELATLILIMLLGHWIEMRSVLGASKALKELVKLIPSDAHLIHDEETIMIVKTSELKENDLILIKPGEKVPTDGIIVKGSTSVNESMLTGESKPVIKQVDDKVIGGSINGEGSIRVKVQKVGKDTYLSQILKLVEEAQKTRSRTQDLANRAAFLLTIIAIIGGTGTFIVWILLGETYIFALERMVTVMVMACPHALGLAVPLVVSVSTSISARNGILVRNRASFERGRKIDKIIFDKTGTLTKGEFGITDVITFDDLSETEILQIVGTLESESEHSIAIGIVKSVKAQGLTMGSPHEFKAIPGKGIQGKIDDTLYLVTSPKYLEEEGIEIDYDKINMLHEQGKTVVFLLQEKKILGAIAVADLIREESQNAIKLLKSMKITPIMLTGDNQKVAAYVAKELGIEEYYAEVLPDEKSSVIQKIKDQGFLVAMVGDGINDAPALAVSDVGFAIGAGTDVAIESADIILVKDNLNDIINGIKLAQSTYSKMKQNLLWATGYNAVALPLAAGVLYNWNILLNPALGAAFMSLSTVIVAINSKFLKI